MCKRAHGKPCFIAFHGVSMQHNMKHFWTTCNVASAWVDGAHIVRQDSKDTKGMRPEFFFRALKLRWRLGKCGSKVKHKDEYDMTHEANRSRGKEGAFTQPGAHHTEGDSKNFFPALLLFCRENRDTGIRHCVLPLLCVSFCDFVPPHPGGWQQTTQAT